MPLFHISGFHCTSSVIYTIQIFIYVLLKMTIVNTIYGILLFRLAFIYNLGVPLLKGFIANVLSVQPV